MNGLVETAREALEPIEPWVAESHDGSRDHGSERGNVLSQVPQPLRRGICGVAWPHSLATAPLCQLVRTPKPISGAH